MSELIDKGDALGVISCFFKDNDIDGLADLERKINRLDAASLWHRVEEDPKKEKRYLVWDVDGFAYCDTWKEGKWQVASTVPGTHITHWMPIEPPKEDEHGN